MYFFSISKKLKKCLPSFDLTTTTAAAAAAATTTTTATATATAAAATATTTTTTTTATTATTTTTYYFRGKTILISLCNLHSCLMYISIYSCNISIQNRNTSQNSRIKRDSISHL